MAPFDVGYLFLVDVHFVPQDLLSEQLLDLLGGAGDLVLLSLTRQASIAAAQDGFPDFGGLELPADLINASQDLLLGVGAPGLDDVSWDVPEI